MRQQVPLAEYPGDTVNLACNGCSRVGRYSKSRLVAQHGAEIGLVTLLHRLTGDCHGPRRATFGDSDCLAHYVELAQKKGPAAEAPGPV